MAVKRDEKKREVQQDRWYSTLYCQKKRYYTNLAGRNWFSHWIDCLNTPTGRKKKS